MTEIRLTTPDGTFDQLLADQPERAYLFAAGDRPVIKAKRCPMPRPDMYPLLGRARTTGTLTDDGRPVGKLAAWLDERYPLPSETYTSARMPAATR